MLQTGIRYRAVDLVPHRGSMCLLDSIDDYGDDWLRASLVTSRSSPFAQEEGIPSWLGIEYMAQAAAAFGGIEQVQRGERPSIGLLIGSRYYRAVRTFLPFDTRLDVLATIAMRDTEDFAAYDCTLSAAGAILAQCTLKAYRPRDLAPLLAEAARD
jgi:predicted hotdog family 3-hydroxylacyl-ACP dehydratase